MLWIAALEEFIGNYDDDSKVLQAIMVEIQSKSRHFEQCPEKRSCMTSHRAVSFPDPAAQMLNDTLHQDYQAQLQV